MAAHALGPMARHRRDAVSKLSREKQDVKQQDVKQQDA